METLNLDVPTVHCRSCKLNIEETLDELHGVATSEVDLNACTVTVSYDPGSISPDAIANSIEQAGYPVKSASSPS